MLKFRRLLEKHQLTERIFAALNVHLAEKGLLLRKGTVVDATIIAAPSSTRKQSEGRDPEMHQAKKGNQWHSAVALRPSKRKALTDTEHVRRDEAIEKLKASIRAKVEHPFH